jgi:hypothetical protein
MDDCFIPECYIDTMLIETIAPPGKSGYNHQKGCGTVTKVMKEKFVDRFAVGIIDKDKREVDYLNEFFTITKNDSLLLHKHNNRHHYIIQINPAMERFIMKSADDVGISLANFNLPTNLGSFSKVSKTINTKKDHRFKQLF